MPAAAASPHGMVHVDHGEFVALHESRYFRAHPVRTTPRCHLTPREDEHSMYTSNSTAPPLRITYTLSHEGARRRAVWPLWPGATVRREIEGEGRGPGAQHGVGIESDHTNPRRRPRAARASPTFTGEPHGSTFTEAPSRKHLHASTPTEAPSRERIHASHPHASTFTRVPLTGWPLARCAPAAAGTRLVSSAGGRYAPHHQRRCPPSQWTTRTHSH